MDKTTDSTKLTKLHELTSLLPREIRGQSHALPRITSAVRRGELGHHHHIAGPYLVRYAQEAAWREDLRRVSNGDQVHGVVGLAMRCRPSVDFCGYWQRARAA